MDIMFSIMALVGAVMAFGTAVARLFLEGVSLINFVSDADAIVYGVMLLMLLANVGWWVYTTRRSQHAKTRRYVSMLIMCLVALGYLVLLTSIWADAWLVSYTGWCASYHTVLTVLRIMGWLLMMVSLGWFTHKLYVVMTTKVAYEVGELEEETQVITPSEDTPKQDVLPDWLVNMDGEESSAATESDSKLNQTNATPVEGTGGN